MRIISDYHIHSCFSHEGHCNSELEGIIIKAISSGLKEIAITDHGFRHAFYGTDEKNYLEAEGQIIELRKKYPEIKILHGIEANILDHSGNTDINEFVKSNCDIILLGFHFGTKFSNILSRIKFIILNKIPFINRFMVKSNTKAVIKAIRKNDFQILVHPGEKIKVDIAAVAEAAALKDVFLEINNSHKHLSSKDLEKIKGIDVKMVINSDAHNYSEIGNYDKAFQRIKEAGTDVGKVKNLEV